MTDVGRRIGVFGGSFDPVHDAHLALAESACRQLRLDELKWVPTGRPWQKSRTVTAAVHREAMLRLAIAGQGGWTIERCELERDGPSYTLDTVRELQRREPGAGWFLIVGRDQYDGLTSWHGWRELVALVTLAVADRPGATPRAGPREVDAIDLALPPRAVSSTLVRERRAAGGPIDDLVPASVADYIERHRLYTAEAFRS